MKTKIILLLLAILASLNIGIAQKPQKFYDQNGKEISQKKLFKIQRKNNRKLIYGTRETDSAIETRLTKRHVFSTLNESEKDKLMNFVEGIIASEILENYITVIMFYQGIDKASSTGSTDPEFFRTMYNNFNVKIIEEGEIIQLNICKTTDGIEPYSKDRIWYLDEAQLIEKLFFEYQYPGGGYVVFDTLGNYIAYLGEYYCDMSIEDVRKLKKMK